MRQSSETAEADTKAGTAASMPTAHKKRGSNTAGCDDAVRHTEELAIGTLNHIDGAVFDGFDYVALGHIHGAQKVLRDTLHYAGSPLKYSFSEARHKKSVMIMDIQEKGEVPSFRRRKRWTERRST